MSKWRLLVVLTTFLLIGCAKGPPDNGNGGTTPASEAQKGASPARQRDPELESKIRRIIVDELGVNEAQVTPEATLDEDLGADELDLAELIIRLEDEFGITIADEDVEEIDTVASLYKHVRKQIKKKDR